MKKFFIFARLHVVGSFEDNLNAPRQGSDVWGWGKTRKAPTVV